MPVPLFNLTVRISMPLSYGTGVHAAMRYHVLSDRHKKSATRIEGGLSPASLYKLNTAMIRKVFEMTKHWKEKAKHYASALCFPANCIFNCRLFA